MAWSCRQNEKVVFQELSLALASWDAKYVKGCGREGREVGDNNQG